MASVGLFATVLLVLIPPWRYYVVVVLRGPHYTFIERREVRAYSPRTTPPRYYHAWRGGVGRGVEHIDGAPSIDALRLSLSITILTLLFISANELMASSLRGSWPAWSGLVLTGILAWAVADQLVVMFRPRIETWLLADLPARYWDELVALPVRIFK
jgi:hypothetical protein